MRLAGCRVLRGLSPLSRHGIACFALVAQCENQHHILSLLVAVERDVAALSMGNQQLFQAFLAWPTDQRMSLENPDPVANDIDGSNRRFRCISCEMVGQSLKIRKRASGVDYFSQDRAFGRTARLPRTRAAI